MKHRRLTDCKEKQLCCNMLYKLIITPQLPPLSHNTDSQSTTTHCLAVFQTTKHNVGTAISDSLPYTQTNTPTNSQTAP